MPKNRHESIEDAERVEDPASIVRPCKNPRGVRSLVLAESKVTWLEEELPRAAMSAMKFLSEAHFLKIAPGPSCEGLQPFCMVLATNSFFEAFSVFDAFTPDLRPIPCKKLPGL